MRVLLLGDLDSVHTRRWISAVRPHVDLVAVGFGAEPPDVDARSLGPSPASTAQQLRSVGAIRSVARSFRPDVVHAHFVSSYGVLSRLAGLDPLVLSAWGSDILLLGGRGPMLRRAVRHALRRAAVVTYDSEDVRDQMALLVPDAATREVIFGPPASWCGAARADSRRIVSPRLPEPLYGIPIVIEAFERAALEGWTLDVLTSGRSARTERRLVEERSLGNRVHFWDRLSHQEVRDRFLAAEIFCSTPRSDGTAASLLEGMACGSFPIVSDLPANRRWIEARSNGLIVGFGDVDGLASALSTAAGDDRLRQRAAAANRSRVESEATWESAVATTLSIYDTVASRAA